MGERLLHRFTHDGNRYVVDPETCFCFECDAITWDLLELYPEAPINHVYHVLADQYPRKELDEVIGEIEWLRAAKSILSPPKFEQRQKAMELERGLRRLELRMNAPHDAPARNDIQRAKRFNITPWRGKGATNDADGAPLRATALLARAAGFLLARGPMDTPLALELRWENAVDGIDAALDAAREAMGLATMAGKSLHVTISCRVDGAGALAPHDVVYAVVCNTAEVLNAATQALAAAVDNPRLAAKAFAGLPEGASGEVTLEPRSATFANAAAALHAAGLPVITVNLETPYQSTPPPAPEAVAREIAACAEHYAGALLKGDYYRLEPIAGLFHRIYLGAPVPRTDPSGLWALAVDSAGGVYPSARFFGQQEHRLGDLGTGAFDTAKMRRYEDVGAQTTPECFGCWARHLCGGGSAAVHEALTENFRQPFGPWCDAQRAWLEIAIATFNRLSSEGVNFARLYGQLGRKPKFSLFTMVRAAFQMNLGLRPLGEQDAELLTRWQNFNDAAYFTFNETGLLMATKYDREMDALHPKGHEFEFLLLRKSGAPMGLMKLRPMPEPGTAMAWLYLRNAADYADDAVRKSFRFLLSEAGKQQGLSHLYAPCGPFDAGLSEFLAATGFTRSGEQREALYLRGAYHNVAWYAAGLTP